MVILNKIHNLKTKKYREIHGGASDRSQSQKKPFGRHSLDHPV